MEVFLRWVAPILLIAWGVLVIASADGLARASDSLPPPLQFVGGYRHGRVVVLVVGALFVLAGMLTLVGAIQLDA